MIYFQAIIVLIDTQWNVNGYDSPQSTPAGSVLIDTQWNVNIPDKDFYVELYTGFNRYIVECK